MPRSDLFYLDCRVLETGESVLEGEKNLTNLKDVLRLSQEFLDKALALVGWEKGLGCKCN